MKDLFSSQSKTYAAFRPTYPDDLYEFIFQHVRTKDEAWDCATGNGQVAQVLARHFDKVSATDISQQQLEYAVTSKNIFYSVGRAEKSSFHDNQFDLITVAQALHWFDRDLFYNEVRRVCKPGALLAVWGYGLLYIEPSLDKLFMEFYEDTVGPYWDNARRLVEDGYKSIAFPFREIPMPDFMITSEWSLSQLGGYLSSWSATQRYIAENGVDPVILFLKSLEEQWPQGEKTISFPIFGRIGRM